VQTEATYLHMRVLSVIAVYNHCSETTLCDCYSTTGVSP